MNGEGLRTDKHITCIQTIDGAISTWFHRPDASQHTHARGKGMSGRQKPLVVCVQTVPHRRLPLSKT